MFDKEKLNKAMHERGYFGVQRFMSDSLYNFKLLDKLSYEEQQELYDTIHACIKAAWQVGVNKG